MIGKSERCLCARSRCVRALIFLLLVVASFWVHADSIRVAAASNFSTTAKALVSHYQASTGHQVTVLVGSTGKQFTQIKNGLKVDVFLAADDIRPKLLESAGHAVPDSRFTYAVGRLVLWSATEQVDESTLGELTSQRIAIANPKFAPYGVAAEQTISALGHSLTLAANLVRGENVAQAYQFAHSGNARFGLVALSQVQHGEGSYWLVPQTRHHAINQQAVLIQESPAGRDFMDFLRGPIAMNLISRHGYDLP